jgi:carbamoyl-phosphate synthase/aspartate carbamoyltransferase/dihydroorotase
MIKIPGMMDPHVHLRSMDWSYKGTFASETAAALAGGYTLILDMPNTPPSTISRAALDRKLAEIDAQAVCDWGIYFGASQSDNTDQYVGVSGEICGLKIYCNATTGDLLVEDQALRRCIYEAWPADRVIAVHAEGVTILEILDLVRQTGRRTHFCHISTAEEIDSLTRAKNEGLPVSVGVTPHHLYLTQDDIPTLGSLGLMKPELKTRADQKALWDALALGVVDVVESDHAPHTLDEKRSDRPPFGVPGLETTLSLMLLAVQEGRLSMERVVELVAANPRRIFGIPDHPETYTLVDLDQSWVVDDSALRTAARWSPFAGMRLPGRVVEVRIRGTKVFDGQDVLVADGFGVNRFECA